MFLRLLGTPNEFSWPNVSSLPDYKPTFPSWHGVPLEETVPTLDDDGIEVLRELLVLDPSNRISAKRVLQLDYFNDVEHPSAQTVAKK